MLATQRSKGDPKPGEQGWDAAFSDALTRYMEAERGRAIVALSKDLTYDERRSLLAYLGVRVEMYRKEDIQPDGTHWRLTFAGSDGHGPQPPLPPTDSEASRSRSTRNQITQYARMRRAAKIMTPAMMPRPRGALSMWLLP